MVTTKQSIRNGRYETPAAIDTALKNTLARLPRAERGKPAAPRRLAALAAAACSALLICGIVVASIPSARAYAEGLLRSVFKLYAGEPDNGFAAAPGPSPSAAPADAEEQDKYGILAANSVPVNVSQTSNGVTATVLEATVAENRLFLGMEFTGLPQYCYPEEEYIKVFIDGTPMDGGSTRKASSAGASDVFTVENSLAIAQEDLPDAFAVRLEFSLRQFPDGGAGRGNEIASFNISFDMDRPASFATLPPDETVEEKKALHTPMPMMKPAGDRNLIEPEGVTAWQEYADAAAGFRFEYPESWAEDNDASILPALQNDASTLASTLLSAYKGNGGSMQVYAVQLDEGATDVSRAADRAVNALFQSGACGEVYDVGGNEVYFVYDGYEGTDDSCIVIMLKEPVVVGTESYGFIYILATKEYNTHILRTLVIQ
jgi:hypothetical protein